MNKDRNFASGYPRYELVVAGTEEVDGEWAGILPRVLLYGSGVIKVGAATEAEMELIGVERLRGARPD